MAGSDLTFKVGHLTLEVSAIGAVDSDPRDRWLRVSMRGTSDDGAMMVALDPDQAHALWAKIGDDMGLNEETT